MLTKPRVAARQWLTNVVQSEVLDIAPPTRVAAKPNSLQIVVTVTASTVQKVVDASGKDKIGTRAFYDAPEDRSKYSLVPLPPDTTWETAMGKAEWLGVKAHGVDHTAKGWAIRVYATEYQDVIKIARPSDWQKLKQYWGGTLLGPLD